MIAFATVQGGVLIGNSAIKDIDLQEVRFTWPPNTPKNLETPDLDLDRIESDNISILNTEINKVNFRLLKITGRISLSDDSIATLTVNDVTSVNFDISRRVGHLTINSASVAGTIRLSGDGPKSADPVDDITLANIACRELQFGSARYIGKAKISNVSCSAVDIGDNSEKILETMDRNLVDSPFYHR